MYGFFNAGTKKSGRYREVAVSRGSTGSYLQLNFEFESHPISIFIWNLAKGR